IDPVLPGEAVEVRSEPWPLAQPASDAEVRMVALGKDPAVPAGHDADLDPSAALVRRPPERVPRDVSLQRDPPPDAVAPGRRLRNDSVGAVGTDEERRPDRGAADARSDPGVVENDVADCNAVPDLGTSRSRLLEKVQVQTSPLRHLDEWDRTPSRE